MNLRFSGYTQFSSLTLAVVLVATSMLLPSQSAQAESARAIEEVVVTARKRDESLQEVPVVVNVLTEDMINSQRIEGITDIGTIVPGMIASKTISGTSGLIFLRGVGTGASNPTFDQAVSINLDGVGIASAQMMQAGMFDLRQIEVLKGPQALFYGKNSPGGVIAIHTNDPTDELEVELSAAYETEAEESTIRGIISGPLGDTLGGRLSFGRSEADSSHVDVYNSEIFETDPFGNAVQVGFPTPSNSELETSYIMGTLLWEPTDNFSAKLKYAHLEDNQEGTPYDGIQKVWCGFGAPQTAYPFPGVDNCKSDDKVITSGANPVLLGTLKGGAFAGADKGFFENENDFAVLEMNYETAGGFSLTSVTGYFENQELRLADASFQQISGLSVTNGTGMEQWSQELRLASNYDGNLNFTLGAFYETKEIDRDTDVFGGSNILGLVPVLGYFPFHAGRQISNQEGTSWSVFGQVNWDISEKTTLAVGGRYSFEEKENKISAEADGFTVSVPLLDPKTDWNNFSPEATLSYQYTDEIMFFASYRTGFKSGGYDVSFKPSEFVPVGLTPGATWDNIYDEEEVAGFEFGMKSTLQDGTLRLNITAFSFDYDDLQLSRFSSDASGALSFRVINAAKASVDGLEVETLWATPVEGLTLTANIAWLNSEFDEYTSDCFTGQTVALGCDARPDPVTGNFTGHDSSGENLPFATDVSANLGVNYQAQVTSNWNLGLNLTASYTDDYNQSSEFIPEGARQDSYWWINASASLYSADDKWEVYVRGINLGDEYFNASAAGAPFTGNAETTGTTDSSGLPDYISYVSGGRQIAVGVSYRL